jgi:hypothetical protein
MLGYRLEHVTTYTASLAVPEVVGPVPEGIRINFYVTDGRADGPRLSGKLRPVGGDWLLLRKDGIGCLDVRATIETHDGALIDVKYTGVLEAGESGYDDFINGSLAPTVKLVTAPRLSCAHPDYSWVNRHQFLGIGQADMQALQVTYDLYAVHAG